HPAPGRDADVPRHPALLGVVAGRGVVRELRRSRQRRELLVVVPGQRLSGSTVITRFHRCHRWAPGVRRARVLGFGGAMAYRKVQPGQPLGYHREKAHHDGGGGVMSHMSGDRVVNGHYQALPDAVQEDLLTLALNLAAEVWTLR